MKRALGLVAILVVGSCVVGAPPGFSKGESWQFPLVGPLENGELITPVFVNDKGPYLFAIDPDSPFSSIDEGVVSEVKPYLQPSERYDDEQDTSHVTRLADISQIKLGNDLTIEHHSFWVVKVGMFNTAGRQIRGVIGHDVLADSLIFGFNRDKGLAFIMTRKGFTPDAGMDSVGYRILTNHLQLASLPVGRRLVSANIGGKDLTMHVDLGAVQSQLRSSLWGDAKLQTVPSKDELVDEIGTLRTVDQAGIATDVTVGKVSVKALKFVAYDDRRWEREDIDGTLGLGFFAGYSLFIDLDKQQLYTEARAADAGPLAKARIDRWGSSALSGCAHLACFEVTMLQPEAPAPAPTPAPPTSSDLPGGSLGGNAGAVRPSAPSAGAIVHLQRDESAKDLNIEVVLEALSKDGKPLGLPLMVANFPQGADTMTTQLDPSYGDATMRIIDASPFVRACPTAGHACLYTLGGS